MNNLLVAPPRTTTRFEFKSRPELELSLLTLNIIEFLEMGEAMRGKTGPKATFGVELEHMLCDAGGNLVLKAGEGEQFARTIAMIDLKSLRESIDAVNALDNKALENTEKN